MAGWFAASVACAFFCPQLIGSLFPSAPAAPEARDLAPGTSNERFALFYTNGPTVRNYTGVAIETNGILSNTTAEFKFPDGTSVIGNLTGHAAHFHKGIGYGNFSIDTDVGQWITVDFSDGAEDVAEFFQWLVTATLDGNVTAEEYQQAVDILRVEAETY